MLFSSGLSIQYRFLMEDILLKYFLSKVKSSSSHLLVWRRIVFKLYVLDPSFSSEYIICYAVIVYISSSIKGI